MDSGIVDGIQVFPVHDANERLVIGDDREVGPGDVQAALLDGPLYGEQFEFDHCVVLLCVVEEA